MFSKSRSACLHGAHFIATLPRSAAEEVDMPAAPSAIELLLLPLDPLRGLRRIQADFDRLAEVDPKLGAARGLLEERFQLLGGDEQGMLGAILWVYVRGRLTSSGIEAGFRRWIGSGETVLRTVEAALESVYSIETMRELSQQGTRFAVTDSSAGAAIEQARQELSQLASSDSAVVVGGLMGAGAYFLYMTYVEGYTLNPPAPPPPPPHPHPSPGVEPEHPTHH